MFFLILCIILFFLLDELPETPAKPVDPCPRGGNHDWKHHPYGRLSSQFYHHGALGRDGHMCEKCFKVKYPETNQAFYDALPRWLRIDPKLMCPADVVREQDFDGGDIGQL